MGSVCGQQGCDGHAVKWLIHFLLLHHFYLGPVFSQAAQPMSPGADGPPVSYAPIIDSRSGAQIPDGVMVTWRMRF